MKTFLTLALAALEFSFGAVVALCLLSLSLHAGAGALGYTLAFLAALQALVVCFRLGGRIGKVASLNAGFTAEEFR